MREYTNYGHTFPSYTYYANGLLKSSFETDAAFFTSQAPQRSDYAYDAAGRVTHARTQQSGVAGLITVLASGTPQDSIYSYDEAGRLSKVTDSSATVTYGYDAAGNRKLVTSRIPNLQKTNPIEHRYRYDYDGANRVQTVVEADVIYDASGNATGLKNASGQTFQFDANGNRVFQQDYTQGTSTQSIAAGSGEAGIYDALTGANQYTYDKAGNLTRTRLVNSSNALAGTYDYSYLNGRRCAKPCETGRTRCGGQLGELDS